MERGLGKRLAYGLGWFAAILAVSCLAVFITALGRLGFEHTYTASLLASIIFFTSCAATLWAISLPARPTGQPSASVSTRREP